MADVDLSASRKSTDLRRGPPRIMKQRAKVKPNPSNSHFSHDRSLSSLREAGTPRTAQAAVAEWYRYRIVACLVTSSIPVPLKTRRVGQRCTLNLSRAETSCRCYTRLFGDGPRNFEPWSNARTTPELAPPLLTTTSDNGIIIKGLNLFYTYL
ncbi:hypothetical protein TNCV_3988971 [Trichonephila clavipes]|nr:hypothetical protein TNCV_3988971 [Trichonephila clavipes]